MNRPILVINSGSSSIKYCLYSTDLKCLDRGQIDRLGGQPTLTSRRDGEAHSRELHAGTSHAQALEQLLDELMASEAQTDHLAVGHRVVHGGSDFSAPVTIDDSVLQRLQAIVPLAPLHQPYNLAAIGAIRDIYPDTPQVACFDTAFHANIGKPATQFGLPARYHDAGVRRYGFHGLSYEYIATRLADTDPQLAAGRVIAAHLGNGASLCALHGGQSVDTSMGFSTLEGLMMGTRCGRLDPGALLYMQASMGMDVEAVTALLYHESGLKGVSGISHDMRDLETSDAPQTREAIDLYVYRILAELGALAVGLQGIDGLVFTGGIGENSAHIRRRVSECLGWLGAELDEAANERNARVISTAGSRIKLCVIPTDEEGMIARHTRERLNHPEELKDTRT
ncbi:acetate kinase [Methylohalomonas lacus]|uniref:Acetate kinase n=1 Tax=Methylohalomonas lacus TaxID=398773 RepID=A0AAE3HK80_9GAMM|nr:acetate/propionate family kinase [Methylohalomonas lacus]MCS3902718.1 acetate kinase [Methylohalomonas lacus]